MPDACEHCGDLFGGAHPHFWGDRAVCDRCWRELHGGPPDLERFLAEWKRLAVLAIIQAGTPAPRTDTAEEAA